jgi:hypothetical protein
VLGFLKLLKLASLESFRRLPVTASEAELRAAATEHKVQYNIMYMLVDLPTMIKEFKENAEAQEARAASKIHAMGKSTEGGTL